MAARMKTTITCSHCGVKFQVEADFSIWHGIRTGKETFIVERIETIQCPHCGAEN